MPEPTLPILYIGNKNYSSWSLRPWLCLRWAGIAFEERLISLRQEGYGKGEIAEVLAVSASGKVPALQVGELLVWESLAIVEWAAEQVEAGDAQHQIWPTAADDRARARAVTCEMHGGFSGIRGDMPMNIQRRCSMPDMSEATAREVRRVIDLWTDLRQRYFAQGPWLLGKRSIADAFFAPVVTRFRTYGIGLPLSLQAYSETLLTDADYVEWEEAPLTDAFDFIDDLYR